MLMTEGAVVHCQLEGSLLHLPIKDGSKRGGERSRMLGSAVEVDTFFEGPSFSSE